MDTVYIAGIYIDNMHNIDLDIQLIFSCLLNTSVLFCSGKQTLPDLDNKVS